MINRGIFVLLLSSCTVFETEYSSIDRVIASSKKSKCKHYVSGKQKENDKAVGLKKQSRSQILKKKAEEIYQKQVERLEKVIHTSGFENYKSFLKFIKKNKNEIGENLIDIVLNEKLEISMRVPRQYREDVSQSGFLNQHQTGSSRGAFSPKRRSKAESRATGIELKEYNKLDNNLKPKYCYIKPSNDLNMKYYSDDVSQYGDDIYVFKKRKVKKRLFWTAGDSLAFNMYNTKKYGKFWNSMTIPWEFKAFIIPFLEKSAKTNEFELTSSFNKDLFPQLKQDEKLQLNPKYWEAQIWGVLNFKDVEKFIFTQNKPSGEFLKSLIKNKVEIFDGRNFSGKYRRWIP